MSGHTLWYGDHVHTLVVITQQNEDGTPGAMDGKVGRLAWCQDPNVNFVTRVQDGVDCRAAKVDPIPECDPRAVAYLELEADKASRTRPDEGPVIVSPDHPNPLFAGRPGQVQHLDGCTAPGSPDFFVQVDCTDGMTRVLFMEHREFAAC